MAEILTHRRAMLTFELTESQEYESYSLLVVNNDRWWDLGNSSGHCSGHLHCRFCRAAGDGGPAVFTMEEGFNCSKISGC